MNRVIILDVCIKELKKFPIEIQGDVVDIVSRINRGELLQMPLSRPMPSIGLKVHELRLKDKTGQFRFFYWIKVGDAIYFVHAFQKKTQELPRKEIDIVIKRVKEL